MAEAGKRQLIINYVPGEECRVAVMQDGKLDEFHSERSSAISHVGNIYVGRVVNVEPSISAAFVDFGLEHNGFLHVSDLHPRYFGGDKGATERVGKKTPRRERPPIDSALRRGQEIIVQVLKEGVGTKGPTVTSYLSIPGRYLVMMPHMDKVGVSRKVEDEDLRARMKAILDQLDLPDECGFILRTAGLDRTKTELKRDLAYLQRLWKDMEKRRKAGGKPRLLYSESDLLVRALRDMMTSEVDQVVIDSDAGLKRAARFIKIVSPRTVTKLVHYTGRTPIFHALGVEEQIRTMYAREVPLPSGGRLVIDEAEALVAIDVNSGKSRSAGDSEQNAYRTNLEAAEEIVRQLRLRDMGGIVVNDLIDMRLAKHRKDVEKKFEDLLAQDRAKSSIAPISEFGILEMTRQRMRSSHESLHFAACPTCHARGLIQKAESVASDALRELAALLDHPRVARVEMVANPRVGAEFLSGKRRALARVERLFDKPVAIRLSDATPLDRVTLYAYDDQGADLEVDRLQRFRAGEDTLIPYAEPGVTDAPADEEEGWAADTASERETEPPEPEEPAHAHEPHLIETEIPPNDEAADTAGPQRQVDEGDEQGGRRGRRRRGRRGRGAGGGGGEGQGRGGPPRSLAPDGHLPARSLATPLAGTDTDAPHADPLSSDDAPRPGSPDAAPGDDTHAGAGQPRHDLDHGTDSPAPRAPSLGDGAPDHGHGPGEGGGRRRRRRRRGRGGRGGHGGPDGHADAGSTVGHPGAPGPFHSQPRGPGAPSGPSGPGGHDPRRQGSPGHPGHHGQRGGPRPAIPSRFEGLAGAFRAEAMKAAQPTNPPAPGVDGHSPVDTASDHAGSPPGFHPGDASPGTAEAGFGADHEGGGRRRRRRRGGRGRGGGGGGGVGNPGGGEFAGGPRPGASPQQGQRPDGAGGPSNQSGGNRPPNGGSSGSGVPNPAPRPRLLYSAFRKLKPGEKGNIKREE